VAVLVKVFRTDSELDNGHVRRVHELRGLPWMIQNVIVTKFSEFACSAHVWAQDWCTLCLYLRSKFH